MGIKINSTKWFVLLGLVLLLGVVVAPNMNADIDNIFNSEVKNIEILNSDISREKMVEIAEAYANFEWYPTENNIAPRTPFYSFFYSVINKLLQNRTILSFLAAIVGIKFVDTPDRNTYTNWPGSIGWKAGEKNIGVPYKWGGFSSISGFNLSNPEDFYEQYTGTGSFEGRIHYAGDIFCESIGSSKACGVDCSGFVSRCWNLKQKQSTRTLGDNKYSWPITFNQLKKGDILNRNDYHVMLFNEFMDENRSAISVYESSGWDWKVSERVRNVTNISEDGYSVIFDEMVSYNLYTYNPIKVLEEEDCIIIEIINIEESNLSEVNWSVTITGGILNLINYTDFGVIPTIESGISEKLDPISLFGFGKILITASVTISSYGSIQKTINGLVIGKKLVLL